jgi:phosphoglycerate kinase
VLAHFGRPKGERNLRTMSLKPVVARSPRHWDRPEVMFVPEDCRRRGKQATGILRQTARLPCWKTPASGRWRGKERRRDSRPPSRRSGDLYVNDAFSAAHRAHVTTEGAGACCCPPMRAARWRPNWRRWRRRWATPEKPVAAVVGGAKVSTKLDVLKHLVAQVDHLIIGGGMANTFLAARGVDVGKSLCEHDLKATALEILDAADAAGCICPSAL